MQTCNQVFSFGLILNQVLNPIPLHPHATPLYTISIIPTIKRANKCLKYGRIPTSLASTIHCNKRIFIGRVTKGLQLVDEALQMVNWSLPCILFVWNLSKSVLIWNFMCNVHRIMNPNFFYLFYVKILNQNMFFIGKARGGLQKLNWAYHRWAKCQLLNHKYWQLKFGWNH